ncbi:MAG: YjiH family protein [Congregibacter sp.]|nr:YjiH family protein [Congregibacter sp.]
MTDLEGESEDERGAPAASAPATGLAASEAAAKKKLISCSLFGIAMFLVPFPYDGSWTIALGVLTQESRTWIGDDMRRLTTPIFVLGSLLAALYNLTPSRFARQLPGASIFLLSHWVWTTLALLAGVLAMMTFLQIGPEWVIGKSTGTTAFVDVAGTIFLIIGLGCLLLPFLTDYGLLDFVGVILQRPFQKAFRLPGRATVDTLASWVGASSLAVIMTGQQYEKGFYTARESAVIATNFSVVSIPFVFFVAQVAGIPEYFFQLYGAMIVVCLICAQLTPLLPPLRGVADEYFPSAGKKIQEDVPSSHSRLNWAWERALATSASSPQLALSARRALASAGTVFLTMMPISMTIEFLALVTYEYTPILQWVTWPLISVLELLQIPEASAAAPGLIIGLFDQFVPAIIAGTLTEPLTQFVLAGLSVTQLIFFSESAILITRSAIPLSVPQLVQIFAIRSVIALPLLAAIGHWVF